MHTSTVTFAALFAAASAYRPGVPPQCFDAYQCRFQRSFPEGAYTWDLSPLCAAPNKEYQSWQSGNPANSFPQIRCAS